MTQHIFTLDESALAYAMAAERIWANNTAFLESNPAMVPLFVSNLFQSLEISIKHIGISAKLFTEAQARNAPLKNGKPSNGHGLEELAQLAIRSIHDQSHHVFLTALVGATQPTSHRAIVEKMIFGDDFKTTRECYASRRLGYGQVGEGDFSIAMDIGDWIQAVKGVAISSPRAIQELSRFRMETTPQRVLPPKKVRLLRR